MERANHNGRAKIAVNLMQNVGQISVLTLSISFVLSFLPPQARLGAKTTPMDVSEEQLLSVCSPALPMLILGVLSFPMSRPVVFCHHFQSMPGRRQKATGVPTL